jgi:hypothetical protein
MSRKSVDLEQGKAARRKLKEIATEHPGLPGEKGPENVQGWESTLAENEMAKTTLVAFRLDHELLKRIDAFAKRLEEQTPGIKLARADAVRAILLRGLEELENEGGSGKKRA